MNTYFPPKPQNNFDSFIDIYFQECAKRFPKIEAIAGKWEYRDLIPGMSDFDTRFLCASDMSMDDWCKMSKVVGQVHLELSISHPEWARILEHLPGVNPTWAEFTSDDHYYPEYAQWSIYRSKNTAKQQEAETFILNHRWDERDEYYFLKKFVTYCGRYNRKIDPPINLGKFSVKYPLHSRIMHYFVPPLQAAVSLKERKICRGKLSALEKASILFPQVSGLLTEITEIVDKHYEVPSLYEEPTLTQFEDRLEAALYTLLEELRPCVTIFPVEKSDNVSTWRAKISAVTVSPAMKLFDSCRFSKLFKGRMYFYANAPKHFENLWLIRNELGRVGEMFFSGPYKIYWKVVKGVDTDRPQELIHQLVPAVLTQEEMQAAQEFADLTLNGWREGCEIETARELMSIFDNVFKGIYKISAALDAFLADGCGEEKK